MQTIGIARQSLDHWNLPILVRRSALLKFLKAKYDKRLRGSTHKYSSHKASIRCFIARYSLPANQLKTSLQEIPSQSGASDGDETEAAEEDVLVTMTM
jgi:hypothetical protein